MNVLPKLTLKRGGVAYTAYSHAVGGKAFNGDPLPTWGTLRSDPKKQHLVEAWCIAADAVVEHFLKLED